MSNLATLLEDSAIRYADKGAFTFMDNTLSYAQTNAAANQVANGLISIGIKPGDKVALSCLNLPFVPIIYYGILKAGAVVVPLSVLLKKDEVAFHLADSQAKALFCFVGTPDLPMGEMAYAGFQNTRSCEQFFMIMPSAEMGSPIEDTNTFANFVAGQSTTFESVGTCDDDTAVIIYTSGTTGSPKGAELTHSNLVINAILCADLIQTTSNDTQLIVLSLFHIFAMTTLMNAGVYRGVTNILLPKFTAKSVFGLMQQHKVSVFAGVPTMFWGLLRYSGDAFDFDAIAENLRITVSSGASLPLQVLEDFEERFDVVILEGYGMSESSPVVTFNQLDVGRKPGSIGTAVWGVSIKLVDEQGEEVPLGEKGELIFKGHNVMKGYYNKPDASEKAVQNGWMHSGDIAIKDEDEFYYIVDRIKDMIIRGGLNVYPREVEEKMMKHEAVSMVAVIGVPDVRMGEDIKAFVVLKEGMAISPKELIKWTRQNIASYKYPRMVEIVDSLPMSATGKILKKELRNI